MGVSAQCPQIVPADQPGLAVESPIVCAAVAGKASSLLVLRQANIPLPSESIGENCKTWGQSRLTRRGGGGMVCAPERGFMSDERRYSHPEFPEISLCRSDGAYSGDTIITWYDRASGQHIEIPAHDLFWHLRCLVNNNIAIPLQANGHKDLGLFFRQLARDIESIGTLLTPPEYCSSASSANLDHFRKRVDGDSSHW